MNISKTRRLIFASLISIAVISSSLGVYFTKDWAGWLVNMGTEITGALITYGLFELIINRQENEENRKRELIEKVGSKIRDVAIPASEEIKKQGWHRDGSLQKKNLAFANWEGIFLAEADLTGADLSLAILRKAEIEDSSFRNACLDGVDFEEAYIGGCKFHGADLREANLVGVKVGSQEWQRMFDEKTLLPDGSRWKPNTDMARFTDRTHPNFWISEYK